MSAQNWRPGKRVLIAGGGPGAISTGLAFLKRGFDVRIFERQSQCKAIGGAVLLCTPVLAILRSYGMSLDNVGSYTCTYFKNESGKVRVKLPFNTEVERRMGIKGWHYGVLRSSAFKKMLELVPEGVIYTDHEFSSYTELEDGTVEVVFTNGKKVTGEILVGADGIRSGVSRQAFGDPKLFHTGIRLWLAWCDHIPGIEPNWGMVSHGWQYQASFFPMLHDGKPGFEWWDWALPMPRLTEVTNFDSQVYRWEIYNRPSMKKWSKGRIVCVGDAVHPVSPYAAYGMGMAIEDGYYLARALDGVDLRDLHAVSAGFETYEKQRIDYVTHNMEFARFLGRMFHAIPWLLAKLCDLLFDYTPVVSRYLRQGYLKKAEKETINLKELQVA
ncbi:hypothetical protein BJX65DRAFT_311535 [Aspergillus insuetus]